MHRINKLNTKISSYSRILCVYSKNICLYVFISNDFFISFGIYSTPKLSYNIVIQFLQSNTVTFNIRILIKIYYIYSVFFFDRQAIYRIKNFSSDKLHSDNAFVSLDKSKDEAVLNIFVFWITINGFNSSIFHLNLLHYLFLSLFNKLAPNVPNNVLKNSFFFVFFSIFWIVLLSSFNNKQNLHEIYLFS